MRIPSIKTQAATLSIFGSSLLLAACGVFSQELRTEILIDSSAESVWRVLTDFDRYPEWNPMIRKIEGEAEAGTTLAVFIKLEGSKGMIFTPTVITADANREFRWLGKLGVRGLFDGEHVFSIEANAADSVTFVHREEFRGALIPLMLPFIKKSTLHGFQDMNVALKQRVERAN